METSVSLHDSDQLTLIGYRFNLIYKFAFYLTCQN